MIICNVVAVHGGSCSGHDAPYRYYGYDYNDEKRYDEFRGGYLIALYLRLRSL
jgi:hypothetical protein